MSDSFNGSADARRTAWDDAAERRASAPHFVELMARTSFSFLEGASQPDEVVRASRELGLSAIGICDRDGLYGLARAYAEARENGGRVLVGAELTLERSGLPHGAIALLAESHDGYASLCRILTLAHRDHEKGTAGISIERVAAEARDLVALVPLVPALRDDGDHVLSVVREAFGDAARVATWRHAETDDRLRTQAAERAHRIFGIPVIATARPLFHDPARKPLADVLACIRHKTTLDEAGTLLSANAERRLRSSKEMLSLFRDHPEWVTGTLDVAERLRFCMGQIDYRFPSESACLPGETPDAALRRLVELGCRKRYPEGLPDKVREQIEKELSLIAQIRVAPYFLSVHEIVEVARSKEILCQGRGSAANSAVCYVLGITAVDPARSSLLFERFLSVERAEPPDIDIDFEHERREEVIQHIYRTYGRDRAAMVSEVISYRGKSALREVGKVFGLAKDQLDRLSGFVLHGGGEGASDARLLEAGIDPTDARLRQVLALAGELSGMPRHLSIHVGGFVLSSEPLDRVAPIEPARMKDRTVIPWDKDDIETLRFFKVDVLGLGMLTAIRKCMSLVHERERPAQERFAPIDALAAIPAEDPTVYAAIQRADTIGVFQIESRAQMAMLPRLKPAKFYDLVIEVAIVRPGPIHGGMVHPYLRRRTGEEDPDPPHPCLEPILDRTLGVPLFQEQVMQIAMAGAGYTPGEADQLRRDMAAWKRNGRLARHRDRLMQGFRERGISEEFGERLYKQIHGFGEYGFPESHAASFALLVYVSAWLKVHHPAAFACALLNSQPMGFYSPSSIVQDAQRHGVEVRPPDVMYGEWDNTLEGDPPALRLGYRQIDRLREEAGRATHRAREQSPFVDLADLVRRAGLHHGDILAFAEAGALESLVPGRRQAMWKARAPRLEGGLFDRVALEPDAPVPLPPLRPFEQLVLDYDRLGLSIADHPMRHVRAKLRPHGVITSEQLRQFPHGARVEVAGLVIGRQRPDTASGVTFVTLEDETGLVNLVVWRRIFEAQYAIARHATAMRVRGSVQREGDVIHVVALELERLILPDADLEIGSRDFH